jgi:Tol biopolymer transport system component
VGNDLGTIEFDLIDSAGNMVRLKSHPGFVEGITWLPDGSGLAYVEQEIGGFTVFVSVLSSAGTDVAQFEQPDGVPDRLIVSPDGSSLAWRIQGTYDLRIQPIAEGDARTYETVRGGSIAWQPLLMR